MGFFDHLQPKGCKALKPEPPRIRKEVDHSTPPPTRMTVTPTSTRSNTPVLPNRLAGKRARLSVKGPTSTPTSQSPKPRKRTVSEQPRLESDSDDDGSGQAFDQPNKRIRLSEDVEYDKTRRLRCESAFLEDDDAKFPMIHAADIASLDTSTKYKPAFPGSLDSYTILVQYPSATHAEKYVNAKRKPIWRILKFVSRYELVVPFQFDDFNPLEDIKVTLDVITDFYCSAPDTAALKDDGHGLLRRLKRARDKGAGEDYLKLILEWNDTITKIRKNGDISRTIDTTKRLDLKLIERILTQTYSRTVSPRVGLLRQYENGTDNIYGELLPKFVSDILNKDTRLRSSDIFVDLGSGVGNVVLQAALEVGCESWGCEMMENACELAELQEKEFKARCRLWGLAIGEIHLERGDFLNNAATLKILQKADVVLVNNQAFTPELNDRLTSHFLDLKEGCKVVSLKSFVPSGHKITSRNLNSAYNVLEVVEKRYYSACVSWTDAPGSYFVSTKDSSKLKAFAKTASRQASV
ncbi:MAG: hypothetical protein Q9167_002897 [Letrouitia subvulpina]